MSMLLAQKRAVVVVLKRRGKDSVRELEECKCDLETKGEVGCVWLG